MQSGLNFAVHAAPFKNTQKEASIALAIEIDGDRLQYSAPNAKGIAANKIELSFYGVNEHGKAMAGTHTVLDLTLRPETRERVKSFGLRVNPRISLPPGRYHVRIGARDAVARHDRLGVLRSRGPRFPQREIDDGWSAARVGDGPADARASSPIRCSRR